MILEIVAQHGGQLPYEDLAGELRTRFEAAGVAFSFGRRSALDTVYELGALGALALQDEDDELKLQLTAFGQEVVAEPPLAAGG